jgi:hypothetical protein
MKVHLEDRDEPIEVTPDQIELDDDDPYLTQDEVDGVVEKRLSRQERSLKQQLKDDDDFWREMAQNRGVDLRDDGQPKGSLTDDEVQALKKKASKVDQLQKQVSEYESTIEATRETKLENELMQAADGVRDDMQDVFMTYAKQRHTYDDEYGWVATADDGDIAWEGGEPKRPADVVDELRDAKPSFFKESSMGGGPDDQPGGSGGGSSAMEDMSAEERAKELNKTRRPYAG